MKSLLVWAVLVFLPISSVQADEFYRDDVKDVVIDKTRGLMWQDDEFSSDQDLSFDKAIAYCEDLDFAGHDDWYLPTLSELKTIVNVDNYPKTVISVFKYTASEYYWSSSQNGTEYGWMILFRNGSTDYYYKRDTNHLRCVRKDRGLK